MSSVHCWAIMKRRAWPALERQIRLETLPILAPEHGALEFLQGLKEGELQLVGW